MRDDIAFLSLNDLVQRFRDKTVSPVEAMEAVYDRLERHEPVLNAFVHRLDREAALVAAGESEARWAKGNPLGPLDGVAVTVKDALLAEGWASRKGSKLTDPDTPDAEDSPAVARVREQGGVLIGKTTMPEFGWKGVTDCPLTGVSRNPWNLDMTCGGSSGGSAAALAAGIGHAAIGTDAGGSVRIPGSFCGLVALKATYGRVPNYPPTAAGSRAGTRSPRMHSRCSAPGRGSRGCSCSRASRGTGSSSRPRSAWA